MRKPMNKALQIYNLKKFLKKHGIDEDLIDLEALVDSSLTYPENKKIVANYIKNMIKNKEYDAEKYDAEYIQHLLNIARELHEERSEQAREYDEKIKSKKVIDLEKSKHPEKDLEKWSKNMGKMDILGIDFIPDFSKPLRRLLKGKHGC
jgi:uncharacterized protein YlxW (UPF0749 family)